MKVKVLGKPRPVYEQCERMDLRGVQDVSTKKFFPSVTSIIDKYIIPKGWIDQYYIDYGTVCHRLVEECINSGEDSVALLETEIAVIELMSGHVIRDKNLLTETINAVLMRSNAAIKWLRKKRYAKISAEYEAVNIKLGYCGHFDLFAGTSRRVIIDWKFAQKISLANKIQGQAYGHMFTGSKVIVIRIDREGKVHDKKMEIDLAMRSVFMSAMHIFRFQESHKRGMG